MSNLFIRVKCKCSKIAVIIPLNPTLKPWAYITSKGVWGGLINEGELGRGAYKRNKKNVSERRDKTYLILLLCVTINGEFISKTFMKPTYATV